VSIVDDKPRELLFLSLYKIRAEMKQHMEARGDGLQQVLETVSHF